MGVRFPGKATIDPSAPEAVGICDRCGFCYNLRALRPQPFYAGMTVIDKGILVCNKCWDVPNPNLQTLRLPADPPPLFNTRIEPFAQDIEGDPA